MLRFDFLMSNTIDVNINKYMKEMKAIIEMSLLEITILRPYNDFINVGHITPPSGGM